MPIGVKLFIALLTILLSMRFPRFGSSLFGRIERALGALSRRPIASGLACLVGVLSGVAGCLLYGLPSPAVHDEFSYLLAADTFAHGRLTSPPHPMWIFFETYHVLQHPTYMSKYPPGQGLVLALGQVLCGLPIVGVWLSVGLACAALFWMLRAWLPPRWSLIGVLLAASHPLMLQWAHHYWGGMIAMTGGCLLLGGFRRLADPKATHSARARDAALAGVGAALCLVSRPFEGVVLTALLTACLVVVCRDPRFHSSSPRARSVVAAAAPIVLTLVCLAVYNRAVTGSPLRLPYQVYERTYSPAPLFVFQPPRHVPPYHHEIMRRFYLDYVMTPYLELRTLKGFLKVRCAKALEVYIAYCESPMRLIPLLFVLPLAWRDPWTRRALLILFGFIVIIQSDVWLQPHYLAPVAGLFFLLLAQGLRQLRVLRRPGRPMGKAAARWLTVFIIVAGLRVFSAEERAIIDPTLGRQWSIDRTRIEARLRASGGKHLILVRYAPSHNYLREWVYNRADIDQSPVVWARDMGPVKDRTLLLYFHDRKVWLLDADATPIVPKPYYAVPANDPPAHGSMNESPELTNKTKDGAHDLPISRRAIK